MRRRNSGLQIDIGDRNLNNRAWSKLVISYCVAMGYEGALLHEQGYHQRVANMSIDHYRNPFLTPSPRTRPFKTKVIN